ncbi:MAG: AAA family ATPase [Alphaproteobacteria bacterium]|nr:AAA family ATPase [Alphaproteobacteria bacterium]
MHDNNNKIIAVASGKGGVGKTWFAITLAQALSKAGEKVLLFDGDFGLANVDIQLGLMAKDDLSAVVSNKKTLNQIVTTSHNGGFAVFDVIVGHSGIGSLCGLPASRLQLLIDDMKALAADYDRVIIDVAAGIEEAVIMLINAAQQCIVVTNDEPTALTDAYALIKTMMLQKSKVAMHAVINSASSEKDGMKVYDTLDKSCKHFLKLNVPLLGIIRRDTKVKESIKNQEALLTRYPFTEAAEDVVSIAQKIIRQA